MGGAAEGGRIAEIARDCNVVAREPNGKTPTADHTSKRISADRSKSGI